MKKQLKYLFNKKVGNTITAFYCRGHLTKRCKLLESFKYNDELSDATGDEYYSAYALDMKGKLVMIDFTKDGLVPEIDDGWRDDWDNMTELDRQDIIKELNIPEAAIL